MTRLQGDAERIVGANVKALRSLHGITVRTLAERIRDRGGSMAPSGITKIEQGSRRVTVDDLVALMAIFNVTADDLLRPGCPTCLGSPPPGFTCDSCGRSGTGDAP